MEKGIYLDSNVSAAALKKRNGDRGGQASQKGCSSRESNKKTLSKSPSSNFRIVPQDNNLEY